MHRIIKGLLSVQMVSRPGFATTRRRPKGAKGLGLRYEKALGEALKGDQGFIHGQWFRFIDSNGVGHCQLDFYRLTSDAVIVLESKLTWVEEGHSQLELLYRPVVEAYWRRPMVGLVVARRLVPECTAAIAQTLPSAIVAARAGTRVVLHWAGKTPLIPRPLRSPSTRVPLSPLPAHSAQ